MMANSILELHKAIKVHGEIEVCATCLNGNGDNIIYPCETAALAMLITIGGKVSREDFARAIWESDESNTTPWGDAREIPLLATPIYKATNAVMRTIKGHL